jgi:predicted nucleic acid-binding protein
MRIYCDSVILIYYFEGAASFRTRASARLGRLWASGDRVVTSDLVRLECRMQPIRLGDATALSQYDTFFAAANVERVAISPAVFDRATVIRATHNFKLGDSLHLAAAVESGCDCFLTNDSRLVAFGGIAVEVLP